MSNPTPRSSSPSLTSPNKLKIFTIEFKDSLQATPSVGYSSYPKLVARPCFQSLCQLQLGQMIQNSVVSVLLQNCPKLINVFKVNVDKKFTNIVLGSAFLLQSEAVASDIYDTPNLTIS